MYQSVRVSTLCLDHDPVVMTKNFKIMIARVGALKVCNFFECLYGPMG